MNRTIDSALNQPRNAFDYLRLFAALLVISSHSYPLLGRNDEIFARLFVYDTGGGFAVAAFFVISGLLITRSAHENDGRTFLLARFLRLAPALILVAAVQYFIIGPIFTRMPITEYFWAERAHIFATVGLYTNDYRLADVFSNNPDKYINGSLWTLLYEWSFYLIIFIFVHVKIIKRDSILTIFIALLGLLVYSKIELGLNFQNFGGFIFQNGPFFSGLKAFLFFLIGSFFYFYRTEIVLSWEIALSCLAVLVFSANSHFSSIAYHVCFAYLVIFLGLGFEPKIDLKKRIGDLSYGVYVFGFPVQQVCTALFFKYLTPTYLTLLAGSLSLLCAWVSWHYCEAPALRLRYKWRRYKPSAVPGTGTQA